MSIFDNLLASAMMGEGGGGGGGGSSDFSTAQVTIEYLNTNNYGYTIYAPIISEFDSLELQASFSRGTSLEVVLYKGSYACFIATLNDEYYYPADAITVSGNATIDEEDSVVVTGNCSIVLDDSKAVPNE